MGNYLLAHDLGTSGNKAVLYLENGRLAASTLCEYPTYYPGSGCVEQNPGDWWQAVCRSTKELLEKSEVKPEQIAAVSFSGQMMGCLLLDKNNVPVRPMMIWADNRAREEEQTLVERIGAERGYRITGHRLSASYSAAKLLWIKNHEPENYKKGCKMVLAKDYIVYLLTGNLITDYSDASGTNLLDITKKAWSEELLEACEIPREMLPEIFPSAYVAGTVTAEAARIVGLLEGTPVVLGGGDGSCACVGAGVSRAGKAYNVLGSSSWISMASEAPVFDKTMRTFNWIHLDPKLYTPCGTMQAAAYSYRWYKDALGQWEAAESSKNGKSPYDILNAGVQSAPAGSGGVLYMPYLLGERSPRWNPDARGAFIGMNITTGKGELARAVLEGVAFNLRVILESLETAFPIEELTVIGGGAKGEIWLEILADIWKKKVIVPSFLEEATSLGAAVCAGVGVGIYKDFSAAERMNPARRVFLPQAGCAKQYDRLYHIFNQAYEALVPVYAKLAEYRAQYQTNEG